MALTVEKTNTSRLKAIWEALGNATTGAAADMGAYADKTVQIVGTFGGATVTIQGSSDLTNWVTLNDTEGDPLAETSAGMFVILENPAYIRAITSGGTGTDVDVIITANLR